MQLLRLPGRPERFKVFLKDPDRKPWLQCIYEFLALTVLKREIAYYYLKHLYKKQLPNIRDYLSTNERARIHGDESIQNYEFVSVLNNKINFAIYFQNLGIRTPGLIGYNFGDRFYGGTGEISKIANEHALKTFFLKLLETNNIKGLFIRPVSALGGIGCLKLTMDNLVNTVKEEWEVLIQGDYLFTELIEQHPEVSKIHSHSINTIRFLTLVSERGEPEVISAAMRFGASEKVVDNVSAGGFFVGVDMTTGTLKKFGWREQLINKGELIEFHPLSGVRLEGFQIPFFKEAYNLVIESTRYLPKKLIGWDVAIGTDGVLLVEGNHDPGLTMPDLANGGLLKNRSFREFVLQVKART